MAGAIMSHAHLVGVAPGVRILELRTFDGEATAQIRSAAIAGSPNVPAELVVVIGASTGGPGALLEIAASLPPGFPGAIAITLDGARAYVNRDPISVNSQVVMVPLQ